MRTKLIWSVVLLAVTTLAAPALAGDLNPPGAPAPTMKSLDDIPGSWHRILPDAERFKLVMGDAAVLDRETGLVWERQPISVTFAFADAAHSCIRYIATGGRLGWRLPKVHELMTLYNGGYPAVFTLGSSAIFWSATEAPVDPSNFVYAVGNFPFFSPKTDLNRIWCVRGPGH